MEGADRCWCHVDTPSDHWLENILAINTNNPEWMKCLRRVIRIGQSNPGETADNKLAEPPPMET